MRLRATRLPGLSAGAGQPVPSLDLDFTAMAASQVLDPRVSFSRGSLGTRIGPTGLVEWGPHNLVRWSEDISQATWSAGNIVKSLDGFTVDTANAIHRTSAQFVPLQAGQAVSLAVELRAAGVRYAYINTNALLSAGVTIDLQTGATTSAGSVTSFTNLLVELLPDGYYRVSFRAVVSSPAGSIFIQSNNIFNATDSTYAGNGSDRLLVRNAQLNLGPLQPYYPTTNAAYFGPRFTYDPLTLAPKGLLIENQRTNLCEHSQQISAAGVWDVGPNTTQGGQLTALLGVPAYRFTSLAANNSYVRKWIAGVAGTTYTLSFLCSSNVIGNWVGGSGPLPSIINNAGSNNSTPVSITLVAPGVYRWQQTFVASINGFTIHLGPVDANPGVVWDVTAVQVEEGLHSTSYIPTASASVTALSDGVSMYWENVAPWFILDQGTCLLELAEPPDGDNPVILILGAGELATYRQSRQMGTWNGISELNSANIAGPSTAVKFASAYTTNSRDVCLNGGPVASVGNGFIFEPANLFILQFRNKSGSIKRLRYYPKSLPPATLQRITAT